MSSFPKVGVKVKNGNESMATIEQNFPNLNTIKIKAEFGGGTELLFDKQKFIELELPVAEQNWNISKLIQYLSENFVKERVELFSVGDKIRPGILILVNEIDYEIVGGHDYVIKNNDSILFISTLHGG